MSKIDQFRTRYENAKEERKRALASLRTDRGPLYAPEEEARRRNEAEDAYRRSVLAIQKQVEQAVVEAESDLAAARPVDPVGSLKPGDLTRANQLRDFVREDAERLGADDLAARLRQVAEENDPVQVALWWRYGSRAVHERFPTMTPQHLREAQQAIEERLTDVDRRDAAQQAIEAGTGLLHMIGRERYLERTYPGARAR